MTRPRTGGHGARLLRFARWLVAAASLAMLAWAGLGLGRNDAGIDRESIRLGATPVTLYRPAAAPGTAGSRPVVLIAHGFAGSQRLMAPFATTLARSGYLAVTFDFLGHGRHGEPLRGDVTKAEGATAALLGQLDEVAAFARSQPDAGPGLAVLGHSMASDLVVRFARRHPDVAATVGVSLFSPEVTATAPENLLIINGALETALNTEALRLLRLAYDDGEAGVSYGRFAEGTARRVEFAPGAEHVGVLYNAASLTAARDWLNAVFGRAQEGGVDRRGGYIVLMLIALVALAWPLAALLPTVSPEPRGAALRWRELGLATAVPALATPLLLWPFPADFLGVLVGGYLAVHFAIYGLLAGTCLWWLRRGATPASPADAQGPRLWHGVLAALLATGYAAGVLGFALDRTVTAFAVTPLRLPLFLAMLLGTLCYFLVDEWLARGAGARRGAQLLTRSGFLLSLALAVALSLEELFFLVIIAVFVLLYFLVYGFFGRWFYRATGHPAIAGITQAVAFAWALAVVFPVLSG